MMQLDDNTSSIRQSEDRTVYELAVDCKQRTYSAVQCTACSGRNMGTFDDGKTLKNLYFDYFKNYLAGGEA